MKKDPPHLSIVSPVYQAEDLIDELVERLIAQLSGISSAFEIILIDDGSKDKSWEKIEEHCKKEARVQGIKLSRNFGQHSAIAAGIEASCGDWVIVMDCDLQDRPEEIPSLYWKSQEGYEIVLAQRKQQEKPHFFCASRLFYRILSFLSGVKWDSEVGNFGIYHRTAIQLMLQVQSNFPYFPAIVNWVGCNRTSIPVSHAKRPKGTSSYTLAKKLNLASIILVFYSERLFKFLAILGVFFTVSSILFYWKFSPTALLLSFFSGLILFSMGTLGLCIGKVLRNIKINPPYLVQKRTYDTNVHYSL